jgi:hypothetical protein
MWLFYRSHDVLIFEANEFPFDLIQLFLEFIKRPQRSGLLPAFNSLKL